MEGPAGKLALALLWQAAHRGDRQPATEDLLASPIQAEPTTVLGHRACGCADLGFKVPACLADCVTVGNFLSCLTLSLFLCDMGRSSLSVPSIWG